MASKLINAPTTEPLTLAEAKAHLRVEVTDDDALITALIVAARQAAELECRRALLPQTWELYLDRFPDGIELPQTPVASVTFLKYLDAVGTLQTLDPAGYTTDLVTEPGWIVPAWGYTWPPTIDVPNAVVVRYVAGYADAASVPQGIKQWMLLRIGAMYEYREEYTSGGGTGALPPTKPGFADCLLDPFRVPSLA